MNVLIVDDNLDRQADLTMAFMKSGFQTTPTGSQKVAETCIRRGVVDLLIIAERVEGKLTHSLALLAEHRNSMVETILLTARTDEDVDELYLLLPSMHCIVAPDTDSVLVTKLAIASLATAVKVDGPIILPPSMRVASPYPTPIFAAEHQMTPSIRYGEISQVA